MKLQVAQIVLLLMLAISSAKEFKECPPKYVKYESFLPEDIVGNWTVTHCFGSYYCGGYKSVVCDYKIYNEKKDFDVTVYSINSEGKREESKGKLKITGNDQYLICAVAGLPCNNRFFRLSGMKKKYIVEYACIPDDKGDMQEAAWVSVEKGVKLTDELLSKIKEELEKHGLKLEENFKAMDNKECKKS